MEINSSKLDQEEELEKAKENISSWLERGKKLVYPQRYKDWEKTVYKRAEGLYYGRDIEAALEVMEAIDKNVPFEQIKEIVDRQNHSGSSYGLLLNSIVRFSKNGPDFYEKMEKDISEESRKVLGEIKAANSRFENELTDIKQ